MKKLSLEDINLEDINLEEILDKVTAAMKEAAQIILNADRSGDYIDEKSGHANFVTVYDTKVQDCLMKSLGEILPEAAFIGEEGESEAFDGKGFAFVVDPIDGTTNFIRDYCQSAISVGLTFDGKRVAGAVYNPYLDQMYTAILGKGAYRNGKPIHVTSNPLSEAIVIFGTAPYYMELARQTFDKAYEIFTKSLDLRRSGTAAIDLCHIADGSADMFFEMKLQPWDFAAGSLIVEEAGGVVTTTDGEPIDVFRASPILATNGCMEQKL